MCSPTSTATPSSGWTPSIPTTSHCSLVLTCPPRGPRRGQSGRAGASEETTGTFMLRIKTPGSVHRQFREADTVRRPVGTVGRGRGRRRHPSERPAALGRDRGPAGGAEQAGTRSGSRSRRPAATCGETWSAARWRGGRARTARGGAARHRARADVRGQQAGLQPAAQVRPVRVGMRAPLRPARDQRHRAGGRGARGHAGLQHLGGRRARRASARLGRQTGRVRRPGRDRSRCAPPVTENLPGRGQAHQAHAGPRGRFWSTKSGAGRLRKGSSRPAGTRLRRISQPGRHRQPAPRPPRHPAQVQPGLYYSGRHAEWQFRARRWIRHRRRRRPLRLRPAALHQPANIIVLERARQTRRGGGGVAGRRRAAHAGVEPSAGT